MTPVRMNIPRPVEVSDPHPVRGGHDAEEMARIRREAERYYAEREAATAAALASNDHERRIAFARAAEAERARAVMARAATLRAEGNLHLAMAFAGGTIVVLLAGLILGSRER